MHSIDRNLAKRNKNQWDWDYTLKRPLDTGLAVSVVKCLGTGGLKDTRTWGFLRAWEGGVGANTVPMTENSKWTCSQPRRGGEDLGLIDPAGSGKRKPKGEIPQKRRAVRELEEKVQIIFSGKEGAKSWWVKIWYPKISRFMACQGN